jgi:perosamine synthetase
MIKLFSPYTTAEMAKAVEQVLYSGQLAQGRKVDEFEEKFAELFKVAYPVSLNSGTAALEMAYELLDLKKGDKVITTPLTCAATNLPLLKRGCEIIWCDIDPETLCLNQYDLWSKLTEDVKAVVQVHLGGIQSDCTTLHDVPLVSDACQALGVFVGDYTCCSFQAIKHITTGDGGMLVVPNEKQYKLAKLLRWFGIDRERKVEESWESYRTRMMCFDIEVLGSKRHMNDIEAAMGLIGLELYEKVLLYRKKLFYLYKRELSNLFDLKVVDGRINTCWLATIIVEARDSLAKKLYEAGVETNVVQVRNDIYKVFGGKKADLPVMNDLEDKYLSLPLGMHVTEEQVNYICSVIKGGW